MFSKLNLTKTLMPEKSFSLISIVLLVLPSLRLISAYVMPI